MGYFKLKEGSEGVLGEPGVGDNKAEPGTADVVHVRDIDFDAMGDDIVPFAILHEGNWLERGEMGWFGMVSNEKDGDAWKEQALKLLKSLEPDSSIEAVDCHI